jgi:hydrogenase expression/formation protein HypD
MKFVDEYRQPEHCERLIGEIRRTATRPWTLMEVCGGQTHGLLRYGIDNALSGVVRLIHGPGCPVCVTPLEAIDAAIDLSRRTDATVCSFGDMLRVPGSRESLLDARADGGHVHIVYSPLDAVRFAEQNPYRQVVFFAVGFETTAPATALAVQQAGALELKNFSLLASHVRVQPAMEMLAASEDCAVRGFLAAGHVCTVAGYESYERFVETYHLPVVVTGFEPVDLLMGIGECVRQLERGEARVVNCYRRSVAAAGNERALRIMDEVYEICDRPWRGLGLVPNGGFRLRPKWGQFDVEQRFGRFTLLPPEVTECLSGDVLTGRIKPTACRWSRPKAHARPIIATPARKPRLLWNQGNDHGNCIAQFGVPNAEYNSDRSRVARAWGRGPVDAEANPRADFAGARQ